MKLLILLLGLLVLSPLFEEYFKLRLLGDLFFTAIFTTVGYGDITPVTRVARAFANLEAVVGQLYLVILVSWLVGMYVSQKSK